MSSAVGERKGLPSRIAGMGTECKGGGGTGPRSLIGGGAGWAGFRGEAGRRCGSQRLALVGVVGVCGAIGLFVIDRSRRPVEPTEPPFDSPLGPREMVDSLHEPIVLTEPPANIRELERSRR